MTNTQGERKSSSDVGRDKAAFREVFPGVVVLVALQGSLLMLDPDGGTNWWNLAWSLLPIIPAAWLVIAQIRSLRRADEYQRMMQLEAMAIGFGAMILLSLAGGLLDAAGVGSTRQSLQITFIVGTLSWIASLAIKTHRIKTHRLR